MSEPGRRGDRVRAPRVAARVLRAALREGDRDAVLAELDELFELRRKRDGVRSARSWYRRQVGDFLWRLLRHGRGFRGSAAGDPRIGRVGKGGVEMGLWMSEMRFAVRRLLRVPVFTGVAVLTIAVGIGAFTAIFGLVEAVLLEPMPYEEPDELAWVWRDYVSADFPRGWVGGPDVVGLREQDVFDGVVALRPGQANLTTSDGADPVRVRVLLAEHDLFEILGVEPAFGRELAPADDVPEAPHVAVLSWAFWQSRFGGDRSVLGRTLDLDGTRTEIVGVAPEDFRFVMHGSLSDPVGADLFVPLQTDLAAVSPFAGSYAALVRVPSGVHPDRVRAALDAAAEVANDTFRTTGSSEVRLWTVNLAEDLVESVRAPLLALAASATFLLLVLSANLATLMLGRMGGRQRELAVRAAVGAGRERVAASVLAESVVLAAAGAVLGVVLAGLGIDLVRALAPADLPRIDAVDLDASVIGVTLLMSLGMATIAGVVPLFHVRPLALSLRESPRGGGSRAARTRSALVAGQMALSLVLVTGAATMARAFADLLRQDPGFDVGNTLTFEVPVPRSRYPETADLRAFHTNLRTRLAALPGVEAAGTTTTLPLTQVTNQNAIGFPDAPGNTEDVNHDNPLIDWFRVSPGYFEAAGYRLREGRAFTAADADTTAFPIIIDDVLARRFFPGASAVGRRAVFFQDTATVVGVIDQARLYDVHSDDRGQVYIPFDRNPTSTAIYALRGTGPVTSFATAARAVLEELDATVPVTDVRPLDEIVSASLGQQRLSLTLITGFALGAVLLASLGIYGVVSNGVERRRHEIGVRMALGAARAGVVRLVVRQGLVMALWGSVVGLAAAYLLGGTLEGVMFGVRASEPLVLGAVALALVSVAALASYLPARRATRIEPVEALHPE